MHAIRGAIDHTVPITSFNRGQAGRLFAEVKRSGAKVVMKNNVAECVLLSPQEYIQLMDELNDARLLAQALKRIRALDENALLSPQDVLRELNITQADLEAAGEVHVE